MFVTMRFWATSEVKSISVGARSSKNDLDPFCTVFLWIFGSYLELGGVRESVDGGLEGGEVDGGSGQVWAPIQ